MHQYDENSGAVVFRRSPEQKAINELKKENAELKELLGALIAAQSKTVKDKLPQDLVDKLLNGQDN